MVYGIYIWCIYIYLYVCMGLFKGVGVYYPVGLGLVYQASLGVGMWLFLETGGSLLHVCF